MVLPRTDDVRRISYASNLARYYGITGDAKYVDRENVCAVDDADDNVQLISQDVIKTMKEAPGTLGLGARKTELD